MFDLKFYNLMKAYKMLVKTDNECGRRLLDNEKADILSHLSCLMKCSKIYTYEVMNEFVEYSISHNMYFVEKLNSSREMRFKSYLWTNCFPILP